MRCCYLNIFWSIFGLVIASCSSYELLGNRVLTHSTSDAPQETDSQSDSQTVVSTDSGDTDSLFNTESQTQTETEDTEPEETDSYFKNYATHYDALGIPTGGCGIPQNALETQNFVSLNVQNTPNNYNTYLSRPISNVDHVGMFKNGYNCGRWIQVKIGDYCTGSNTGYTGTSICENGNWISDQYNDATLNLVITDSCHDGDIWCRDQFHHIKLSTHSLSQFKKDNVLVPSLKDNWNNRKVSWKFIEAPSYQGDIKIGFIINADKWWPAIAITQLKNGIHGVDCFVNNQWEKAAMESDNGQLYILKSDDDVNFKIRVYDTNDTLINNGRIYKFQYPASCGTKCSAIYTPVYYTIE